MLFSVLVAVEVSLLHAPSCSGNPADQRQKQELAQICSEPEGFLASLPVQVYSVSLSNAEAVRREEKCHFIRDKTSA